MRYSAKLVLTLAFWVMGTNISQADRQQVQNFWIDRTEVTVGAFKSYVKSRKLITKAEQEGGGFEYGAGWERRPGWTWKTPYGEPAGDREPVTHVSWQEAADFCAYAGGRLPTWEEWRRAAYTEHRTNPTDSYETGRTYPYPVGDNSDGMNSGTKRHVPVASSKRGVNGLHDMGGNVWEWIADRRGQDALTAGASWWYGPEKTRQDGAQWKAANFYAIYIGFRCVYDTNKD